MIAIPMIPSRKDEHEVERHTHIKVRIVHCFIKFVLHSVERARTPAFADRHDLYQRSVERASTRIDQQICRGYKSATVLFWCRPCSFRVELCIAATTERTVGLT